MRKKILIISTSFPRWKNDGFALFVQHFAEKLKESCDIHVLAPHIKGVSRHEDINGITVHRFVYAPAQFEKFGTGTSIIDVIKDNPVTLLLIPFFVGFAFLKIVSLHLQYQYDVIHVHWIIPFGPVVGFLRLFFRFRYILTSHGSDVFPFVNLGGRFFAFVSWLHRMFTFPNADRIVTVSNALKSAIVSMQPGISQEKLSVVSMGIDYRSFMNERQRIVLHKPLRIAYVGRLTEIKGVKYLIDAMSILRAHNIEFDLQIYGDGLLRKSLEDQVLALSLSEYITFNGFVGHDLLPQKLTESDFFVGPSIVTSMGETEGLGLVFLEAMAAGLVVIGSDVGGISDIITDKVTGVLVEQKKPEAIAQAIEFLANNDILRMMIVENGIKFAKQYDWTSVAQKYLQIYGVENQSPNLKGVK